MQAPTLTPAQKTALRQAVRQARATQRNAFAVLLAGPNAYNMAAHGAILAEYNATVAQAAQTVGWPVGWNLPAGI